jgi:cobyrinic acid a,c-diamide synthase
MIERNPVIPSSHRRMSCLYVSAAHKSSGKTTLTLGLGRALRQRGLKVQTYKKGPDYIDPIWHGLASGRPCYNLDFHMMTRAEILNLFARHAATADIALIEGNKGLYDGMDLEGGDSNAAMAKLIGAPVVLVLDSQGMTRGIAPLILGYRSFDAEVKIAGVILNKVGGPRHEGKLRAVIERYTDLPVLGALPRTAQMEIAERHLGLVPGNETPEAEARIEAIAALVAERVDLDALLALAAPVAEATPAETPPAAFGAGLRIAIARDRAFGFYYQEDLDTLRAAGVELLAFDTLSDERLPEADGLILGGGFPEVFIERLAANRALRADIRRAIEAGLPTYAECGGLMYLSRSIAWGERRGEMVGVVPGDCVMQPRPVGRGYALLAGTGTSDLAPANGGALPAHEFHHSSLVNLPQGLVYAYRMMRGVGMDGCHDGFVYKNLLAAYCHRRGSGERGWIAPFLDKVRAHARQTRSMRRAA